MFGNRDTTRDVRCEQLDDRKWNECCAYENRRLAQLEISVGASQPIRIEENLSKWRRYNRMGEKT